METIVYLKSATWTVVIFRFFLASVLTGFFAYFLNEWRKFVSLVGKIPQAKLRWYHIFGHAHYAFYARFRKLPLSLHIYDFIGLNALCFLIKEGFANFWAFSHPIVFVYKADTVEVILNHSTQLEKSWQYSFTHAWLGRGLLTSYGTKWKIRRKLLTPAFHFNILHDFLPVINSKAKIFAKVLDGHINDEFINIVPYVTRCSLDVICDSILGVEMHAQTNPSVPYVQSVNILTESIGERLFNPLIWADLCFKISPHGRKTPRHIKLVHDFTLKLIKEKKSKLETRVGNPEISSNDDDCLPRKKRALLDLLLSEHMQNEDFSEKDIMEEVDTFTFEGHDTTAMGISFFLYLIGLHPGYQEKVRQELDSIFGEDDRDATMEDLKEMKYLECVLKESLRLYPPVSIFGRRLNEDIEIEGRTIPKGSSCMVFAYLLHRNSDIFTNPEKFDPDRFSLENSIGRHPFAYIPFSAGPRNCIGQRFALMEMKVVISTILRKFKIRSLDPRDKVQVISEVVLRPSGGLRLEIRPRNYIPHKPSAYYHYP